MTCAGTLSDLDLDPVPEPSPNPLQPPTVERECVQLSLRYTLDVLLAGEGAPFSRTRHTALTVGVVASSLAVALAVPDLAEKIFAVTGATGAPSTTYDCWRPPPKPGALNPWSGIDVTRDHAGRTLEAVPVSDIIACPRQPSRW